MKFDYVNISVVFGVTIVLVDIFFNEYLFGFNNLLILLALLFIAIAYFKQSHDEKKKNK